ncbi:interferon phi 3 [Cololabis saira]|uniref:interferon phi 3 n=1 Tax=Cololabis saira TaxID=129043 RepID=UPI002AD4DC70|nr:interferon phi 3 [Cololabis saira]
MKPSSVLLLLQLCCLQVAVLVSRSTCRLPETLVQETHHRLRDLGGSIPNHCKTQTDQIHFPESILSHGARRLPQCRWTSMLVYGALQGAQLVFDDYVVPEGEGGVSWDSQNLDLYQNVQYRLVEDHPCLNNTEASAALAPYFSNVTALIAQQDSAACGWQVLRTDLLWVLKSTLHNRRECFNRTKAQ